MKATAHTHAHTIASTRTTAVLITVTLRTQSRWLLPQHTSCLWV